MYKIIHVSGPVFPCESQDVYRFVLWVSELVCNQQPWFKATWTCQSGFIQALVTPPVPRIIYMSRGAKSFKSEAAMGPSSQPLNEPELTQAAGLLARAVKHGQESLILQKYIHEPGHNKAIASPADHVMKEIG